MEKNKDIFYFSSTHWDREWYQTFQGFRARLVKMMDGLLEGMETLDKFGVFHLDGQTIVLDDYAEIKPENAQKLKKFIADNKIKIGPWYVMPDEFNLSGESLIRNIMLGHEKAKEWGADSAWKFGYICDIFGHIAQMPQIFNGFDIKYSYASRGYYVTSEPYFVWKAPNGSETINFRIGNINGYGEFTLQVVLTPDRSHTRTVEELKEPLCDYMNYLLQTSKIPIYIASDAYDHAPFNFNTLECIDLIKEAVPDANVHHVDLIEAGKALEKYRNQMEVVEGELNKTNIKGFPDVITYTLSSYYPLKKYNDKCQNRLEKIVEPMLAYSLMNNKPLERQYAKLAYKYLIQNQPHDSICGCSIDQVHKDMEYRYDQSLELCKVIEDDYKLANSREHLNASEINSDGILTLINTLPYDRDEVITVDIPMKTNFGATYAEPFYYEDINCFSIVDSDGNKIPYQVIDINRYQHRRIRDQFNEKVDCHKITFRAKVPAAGKAEYRIVAQDLPSRYLEHMNSGSDYMENEFVRITFNPDGTINIYDKATDIIYDNQLSFRDDGEIGDGWYHVNPKNDRAVFSSYGDCIIEKIESGYSRCVFRVTKDIILPKEIIKKRDSYERSNEYIKTRVSFEVGLSENAKYADIKLVVNNNAKDHRLSLVMPTYTNNDEYFAGQAFYCCKRTAGIDYATQNWFEHEKYEKAMNGIVGRRDENGNGIAFVSAEGLHECGAYNDDYSSLYITLLRSFSKTVQTNGETRCQLLGEHTFKFNLVPLSADTTYADLLKIQDTTGVEILSSYAEVRCEEQTQKPVSSFKLTGKDIVLSVIKCAENGNGIIVRVFNASDEASEAAFEFAKNIKCAYSVNLNEEKLANNTASYKDNTVKAPVNPWEIVTVMVEF